MTLKQLAISAALALIGLSTVQHKTKAAATGPAPLKVVNIGAASHEGNGVAIDASGNIYLTGQHQASRYDSETATRYAELGGVEFVANQRTEFFLMKLDADLNVLWTRVGGSAQYDYGTSVRIAANGDAIVVAAYQDDFTIDGQLLDNITSRRRDSFVARYNSSGEMLWIQTITGAEDVTADDVEIDSEGSIYVGGRMRDLATFETTQIGARFQNRIFLAKYNGAGEFQWAKEVVGTSDAGSAALDIDTNGNVIVAGTLSTGAQGVFLASYNVAGTQNWITQFDTGNSADLSDVEVDTAGNITYSGRFSGSTFDLGNSVALSNPGTSFHGYVAKVDAARTPLWMVSTGTRGYEFESDNSSNIIVAGYHQSPILSFATESLTDGLGGTDAFVGSISPEGGYNWSLSWASDSGEICRAIAIGADQSIVVVGEGSANSVGLDPFNGRVFIAKFAGGPVAPPRPALSISVVGEALEISWPEAAGNYALETAASLAESFGQATATPVDGKPNTFRIDIVGETLFIRLRELVGN